MRRLTVSFIMMAFIAACGGGDDEADPSAGDDTGTPTSGETSDGCAEEPPGRDDPADIGEVVCLETRTGEQLDASIVSVEPFEVSDRLIPRDLDPATRPIKVVAEWPTLSDPTAESVTSEALKPSVVMITEPDVQLPAITCDDDPNSARPPEGTSRRTTCTWATPGDLILLELGDSNAFFAFDGV